MASPQDSAAEKRTTGVKKTSLYDYAKVYPRQVFGHWRRLKWAAAFALLAIYWLAPWLRWDRGFGAPDQAILIDLPGRRAYFFFIEIWPQEVYYLTGLLILAAIGLFLFTALFGRVWCGFACWQTVWTDVFLWIETKVEGERNERMARDRGPMTGDKLGRKVLKLSLWGVVSVATGYGFLLYFADAPTITRELLTGAAGLGDYGFVATFSAFPFVLAGWAREQVCIYMCPWPRFQAAMFDEDSTIITYEAWRGEARGTVKGRPSADTWEGRGHCVDCKMCIQACPTGIDIRDGSQLACIGCALCVDACNSVMDKFKLPRGLITYDSVANQLARSKGETARLRLVRSRTVFYALMMVLVGGIMVYALATRSTTDVNVLHERSPLFVPLTESRVRNGYTYKILNMIRRDTVYTLSVEGLAGATLSVIGYDDRAGQQVDLPVVGDSVGTFRLFVTAPSASLTGPRNDMTFVLTEKDTGKKILSKTLFAGP